MGRNILVVNGHPDPGPERFCAALCEAYEAGARTRGYATRRLDVGALHLSALSAARDADAAPLDRLEQAFRLMRAADRLAIFYPLLSDGPPEELSQLFDYIARLRAHLEPAALGGTKSARIVVTTSMPAFLYRGRAEPVTRHRLCGVAAGEPLFIGSVDTISSTQRTRWLEEMRGLGEKMN
ncbi:MAG: NAD(P)H-dependent oxidoreductase [Rhizomicrobium sp.]